MADFLALAICLEEDARRVPRRIISTRRIDCFNFSDAKFVSEFRLNKQLACGLIEELKPYLEPRTLRRNAFNTEIKVLCALNFFASGSYQKRVGNDRSLNISQRSVSNCIRQVSEAISTHLLSKYIQFPGDQRLQETIKKEFFDYCGLGGVVGAIDCTHVAIIAPPDDGYHHERNYVNRKGYHSINVQLVCDMQMKIINICARFPGCSHDAYIWRSCNLKLAFEVGHKIHGDGWLLGDSGYKFSDHLHTPIDRANPSISQQNYNNAHARGRNVIERCNGVLKSRFRCLLRHRTLNYMPEIACKIINSCAVLHNMCIDHNMIWEEEDDLPTDDELFDTSDG